MPLTLAAVGEEHLIRRIGGSPKTRQHLENLGFVAGGTVTVISEIAGNMIVHVKGSRIAIDRGMAEKIFI